MGLDDRRGWVRANCTCSWTHLHLHEGDLLVEHLKDGDGGRHRDGGGGRQDLRMLQVLMRSAVWMRAALSRMLRRGQMLEEWLVGQGWRRSATAGDGVVLCPRWAPIAPGCAAGGGLREGCTGSRMRTVLDVDAVGALYAIAAPDNPYTERPTTIGPGVVVQFQQLGFMHRKHRGCNLELGDDVRRGLLLDTP